MTCRFASTHRRPVARDGGRPVVVNFHGGGFALGSARQGDWSCSIVARDLDAVVVSVDYRLAPTHRFPAAVEDCYAALGGPRRTRRSSAATPTRLGVMGDSAGGNLAAVVGGHGPRRRRPAVAAPGADLPGDRHDRRGRAATRRTSATPAASCSPNEDIEVFRDHYFPEDADPLDYRCRHCTPATLEGLPPAVVVVAGLDPLHDSGVRYAAGARRRRRTRHGRGLPPDAARLHQLPLPQQGRPARHGRRRDLTACRPLERRAPGGETGIRAHVPARLRPTTPSTIIASDTALTQPIDSLRKR